MNKVFSWISSGAAYILVMKGGSQHCIISSQDEQSNDDWISGSAGVAKTLCLYEDEDIRKLILDYREKVETIIQNKTCKFIQPCLVEGPKMMVKSDEISIIEESNAPILSRRCFDEYDCLIEENVVKEFEELKRFWSQDKGFARVDDEWRPL